MSDSESEGGVPLIEAEFDVTSTSKKRKREAEPESSKESKKAAKKAKRKEKKKQKAKEIDEDDLDQELGVNHSFERMDGQLLADYINSRTRLYGKDLSSVELEDKFISARTVKDSTSWTESRITDNLAAFLKNQAETLKPTPSKPPGAPHTIVVTASGIRAADVCRALKSGLPKQGVKNPNVAKLFAKHLKLADQVAHLKKNKIDLGVGTPDRLVALLEEKALSTANLKRVFVDVSYIDQKKRGILDMKELHESLIKLLLRKEFIGESKEDGSGLFLFY
ncbi:U3-containing 90S pre-ribosomal complex subunit-domain containing protein [Pyrenochaeta sp. MPI-SDFR-AT-0127]|nr:U3-containing 90S pre-ribosomal complex subunit-domain containing protein [Pyrenochaeta sp. MPI-SDFR-AT-0127]